MSNTARNTVKTSLLYFILTSLLLLSQWTLAANPKLLLETNQGNIELELFQDKAPLTVKNILAYVNEGFYNGTIFHRVISKFMIQGGGFDAKMKKKSTHAPVNNEAFNGVPNVKGTIAMARTSDPHSATAQFFINTKDNDFLNFSSKTSRGWGYTVFGKVTKGMDVVMKIDAVTTGFKNGMRDVPVATVEIIKASILK